MKTQSKAWKLFLRILDVAPDIASIIIAIVLFVWYQIRPPEVADVLFRVALIALHNFVEKLVANRQCILDIQPPVHGVQKEFHHRQYFIGIYADLPQFSGLLSIY